MTCEIHKFLRRVNLNGVRSTYYFDIFSVFSTYYNIRSLKLVLCPKKLSMSENISKIQLAVEAPIQYTGSYHADWDHRTIYHKLQNPENRTKICYGRFEESILDFKCYIHNFSQLIYRIAICGITRETNSGIGFFFIMH